MNSAYIGAELRDVADDDHASDGAHRVRDELEQFVAVGAAISAQ